MSSIDYYKFSYGEDDGMLIVLVNNYPIIMGSYEDFDGVLTDDIKEEALYYYELMIGE